MSFHIYTSWRGLESYDIQTIVNPELLPYVTDYKFHYDIYQDNDVSIGHALEMTQEIIFVLK